MNIYIDTYTMIYSLLILIFFTTTSNFNEYEMHVQTKEINLWAYFLYPVKSSIFLFIPGSYKIWFLKLVYSENQMKQNGGYFV